LTLHQHYQNLAFSKNPKNKFANIYGILSVFKISLVCSFKGAIFRLAICEYVVAVIAFGQTA
jgi:hypothetical protein